jgi:hypothetical protein
MRAILLRAAGGHGARRSPPALAGGHAADAEALRHRATDTASRARRPADAVTSPEITWRWRSCATNRHRTGNRYTPLIQTGSSTAGDSAGADAALPTQLLTRELLARESPAYVYSLLLRTTPFEHSTHGDKFIYEANCGPGWGRTRYAEHQCGRCGIFRPGAQRGLRWRDGGARAQRI